MVPVAWGCVKSTGAPGYRGGVRRPFRTLLGSLVVVVVVAGVLAVRRLRAERRPRHELNGSGPALGSLDTWPAVRRSPDRPPAATDS